jgi:hypothetical protein
MVQFIQLGARDTLEFEPTQSSSGRGFFIFFAQRITLEKRVDLKITPVPADLLYLSILNNCIINDERC